MAATEIEAETASPMASAASKTSSDLNWITILIVAVVGSILLSALLLLAYLFLRARRRHQGLMRDLEQRGIEVRRQARYPDMAVSNSDEVPRPRNVLRRATFSPFTSRNGWNTLESREDVSRPSAPVPNFAPQNFTRPIRGRRRSSHRMSWKFPQRLSSQQALQVPVMETVRLSDIVESPMVSTPTLDSRYQDGSMQNIATMSKISVQSASSTVHSAERTIRRIDSMSNLRPNPLTVKKKRDRAQTMVSANGAAAPQTDGRIVKRSRPSMHARSFSLGSQSPGSAPTHAVPPLPLNVFSVPLGSRPRSAGVEVSSRLSVSSLDSISSSLLVASPKLHRSASERSARVKNVARRDYANSLITGPRQPRPKTGKRPQSSPDHNLTWKSLRGSIRSFPESFETNDGAESWNTDRLSLPDIKTAEAVRISRIWLANSSPAGLNITTPRRESRLVVDETGSPAQRNRAKALKEVPGTAQLSRQISQKSNASSTRSSNGNPFQFDPSPMASGKPSAMKGSPNSRGNSRGKGHKRSIQVRIDLSPMIIHANKRGSSPFMAEIAEEAPQNAADSEEECAFRSSMGALPEPPCSPRPPSSATFEPQVKLQPNTFRASLTPSSPTLSSMRYSQDSSSQDQSFGSQHSASKIQDFKRHSQSSVLTIPAFPSPGKVNRSVIATPVFTYTRPSNEYERSSTVPESFMLLAQPYSPPQFTASAMAGASRSSPSLAASSSEQLVFPKLEKEELKAGRPPFETLLREDERIDMAPVTRDVPTPPRLELPPMSPPCSPKSFPPSIISTEPTTGQHLHPATGRTQLHAPSPMPGVCVEKSPLLSSGNQVEPPSSELRTSIAQLRRMNSEANEDANKSRLKAARRYQRIGIQGEPPATQNDVINLSQASQDSMGSLWEIDQLLDCGILPEVDTPEDEADRQLELPKRPSSNFVELKENDQECWSRKARPKTEYFAKAEWASADKTQSPVSTGSVSPLSVSSVRNRDNIGVQSPLSRRISELRGSKMIAKLPLALKGVGAGKDDKSAASNTPDVIVQPPSSEAPSPGSLYDENGFMKEDF